MELIQKKISDLRYFSTYSLSLGPYSADAIIADITPPGGTSFLFIHCKNGFMACRLLNVDMASAIGSNTVTFAAGSFEAMMEATPAYISDHAREIGVTEHMTGADIFKLFSK